jgi:hypothetical protein
VRSLFHLAGLAIGAVLTLCAAGNGRDDPLRVTRGPYLQQGTPESAVIRWRTNVATDSVVRLGPRPDELGRLVARPGATTEHEVAITGLAPATRYYYAVGSVTATLAGGDADHHLVTPPVPGTAGPFRIWVLGDSGTANADAAAVRDAYLAHAGDRRVDVWLMLGDNAYFSGTDREYQKAVFEMFPHILRNTFLWSTLGNHDGYTADSATGTGPYYDIFTLPRRGEAGGVASGTEAYYSFDHGNVHFICLESYETDRSRSGAMMTWLAQDLAATRADWIIAFWHHPPYSKGSHDSDRERQLIEMRENALPVLEAGGVDLVLAGHSHSYERSVLLDGHYGRSDTLRPEMMIQRGDGRVDGLGAYRKLDRRANAGAVYVVAGSSGSIAGGSLDHPVMHISLNRLGSLAIDVEGRRLDSMFITADGAVADRFRIEKPD